jgi:hypothetical protein
MNTVTAITVALLAPFWWSAGLLVVALSGDLLPAAGPHVARLLERLKGTRTEAAAVYDRYAA